MSNVIHAEADFKGRAGAGKTPLCMKWAMSRKWGQMTTENAKISCTRCAKTLGIEPAAVIDTGSPSGTCQCCFGTFKAPKSVKLSVHGYQRPGCGFIIGRCRGAGHAPFEVSCERTKIFRAELYKMLATNVEYLRALKAGEIKTLLATIETAEKKSGRYGAYGFQTTTVEVALGAEEAQNPHHPEMPWKKIPSYETLQNNSIRETESVIDQIKSNINFLTEKIEGWTKQVWPAKKG
jgi:hypothetical protein